ncbi:MULTISPECIES: TetR/AcrR family transcriptional regulator [Mycolicibacterium]|uniref:TetR family transcriptional regulator n=1 Tax=Mycolicibacterium senegalense TaxID=1796 RepID=A0A378W5B4_9MYCO|nr:MULTISPECIES: TetR/AcrR family transcriptional regulator [Mycolicibacterium]MCV7337541.1 TetR/AcrR family transcriptional regulator [Mycolicibacterium senegalense]MDR7289018.1 AcrR family transcriptional regulator [Mycolicibacterium senegalense]QZA25901.1 TetR/AcrR family transcriptional regulator [Mycolicibacterium senegalense]CDP84737.1 TetR family transcriptional regulator [Mycolicibacterium farcinogenes]SUA27411.1 TetR family transcriptional regulator [Mycolicibacterium senegalense]
MSPTSSTAGKPVETRVRLLESATDLFSRQGFGATGIKAVLAAAEAPYGSLYHFFPGGKQELGAAALTYGGERYRELLESVYPADSDVVEATADSFDRAAKLLEETDYGYACPIATIALEVANNDELMRTSAADAFESWLAVLQQRFTAAGMTDERARDVAVEVFCLIEGAVLLSRTTRSSVPMHTAGRAAANAVAAGLEAAAPKGRSGRGKGARASR